MGINIKDVFADSQVIKIAGPADRFKKYLDQVMKTQPDISIQVIWPQKMFNPTDNLDAETRAHLTVTLVLITSVPNEVDKYTTLSTAVFDRAERDGDTIVAHFHVDEAPSGVRLIINATATGFYHPEGPLSFMPSVATASEHEFVLKKGQKYWTTLYSFVGPK